MPPRQIDPVQRRTDITSAAIRILARGGASALTLRSLAKELGGSITLVTHFFSTREDIFTALIDDVASGYEEELAQLEDGADAESRLRILLEWLVPLSDEDVAQEAGRIALISQRGSHAGIDHFFEVMESRVRKLLEDRLAPLLPAKEVGGAVDYLRATTNGVVLSSVEHPEVWTRERRLAVLETALRTLAVASDAVEMTG